MFKVNKDHKKKKKKTKPGNNAWKIQQLESFQPVFLIPSHAGPFHEEKLNLGMQLVVGIFICIFQELRAWSIT